jgi:3-oxoacyl-[acyl-carrier protein] reductase
LRNIEDFKVGERASFKHKIVASEVETFGELTGDDNPLHLDEDYAETTPFKGPIAHGMLTASFISTIIGKHLPGQGALWLSQNLEFLLPVRVNDEIEVSAEITTIHQKQHILVLKVLIKNQNGQKVIEGECKVRVLKPKPVENTTSSPEKKVVLVTGASRGIGAAIARKLAAEGFRVAINYRTDKSGAEKVLAQITEAKGEAFIAQADVSDAQAVEKLIQSVVQRYGAIHGIVNNAASAIVAKPFEQVEWEDIDTQLQSQLKSCFLCIKAALPHFEKSKYGSIVNLGSVVVDMAPPPPQWIAYNLAKTSVHALTKSLAEVLGPKGIRVNTVAPGMTDTRMIADVPEKVRLLTEMQTPLRRLAVPEDVASAVAFLMSDGARHITGETLRVNGGKTLL